MDRGPWAVQDVPNKGIGSGRMGEQLYLIKMILMRKMGPCSGVRGRQIMICTTCVCYHLVDVFIAWIPSVMLMGFVSSRLELSVSSVSDFRRLFPPVASVHGFRRCHTVPSAYVRPLSLFLVCG